MKENPANAIKDTMWKFLMDKGQKSNIPALKEYVYDLIQMTTQKTAGQRKVKDHISWDELDMTIMSIVIEATALVLSGDLDEIEGRCDMEQCCGTCKFHRTDDNGEWVCTNDLSEYYALETDYSDICVDYGEIGSDTN